jgi:hypothetical protein
MESHIRQPQISHLQLTHHGIDRRHWLLSRTCTGLGVAGQQMRGLGHFCADDGVSASVEDDRALIIGFRFDPSCGLKSISNFWLACAERNRGWDVKPQTPGQKSSALVSRALKSNSGYPG